MISIFFAYIFFFVLFCLSFILCLFLYLQHRFSSLHFRTIFLSFRFHSLISFIFLFTLCLPRRNGERGCYQMDIQKRLPAYFYAFYTSKSIVLTKLRVLNLSQHLRSTYQSLDLHLEQISFSLLFVLDHCIFFYNLIIIKTRLCLEK